MIETHDIDVSHLPNHSLMLLESADQWVLAPKPDPDLRAGGVIRSEGQTWRVVWESDEGFRIGDVV